MKLKLVACCLGIAISGISTAVLAADVAVTYDASVSNLSPDTASVELKVDSATISTQPVSATSTSTATVSASESRSAFPRSVNFGIYKNDASGVATLVSTISCPVDKAMAAKANAPGLRDRYTLRFSVDAASKACKSEIVQTESAEGSI